MGLVPPPTNDSGWKPIEGVSCHICGAAIYSRVMWWGENDMNTMRALYRHGDEGGAVTERGWDSAEGYGPLGPVLPGDTDSGYSGWERPWERQVHATLAAEMAVG